MSTTDELVPMLKKLKLSGILHTLELRLRESGEDDGAHEEFLFRLLRDEVERRDAKQLDQRLRRANFEHQKTLEDFEKRVAGLPDRSRFTVRYVDLEQPRTEEVKVVTVYRLVAAGTIEEKILQMKDKKRQLVASVLTEDSGGAKKLTKMDLDDLFRVD